MDEKSTKLVAGTAKPPAAGKGRPKGARNKTTKLLSHAILEAAKQHGLDKEGKGELTGYCRFLAEKHPVAFSTLLGKVLPMQITGSGGGPISHEFTVKFKTPDGD